MRLGMRHDGRHDYLHEKLGPQRYHVSGDVRRIAHESLPHRLVHVIRRGNGFLRAMRSHVEPHVEPMNVIDIVITTIAAIRRPPHRRRPPQAHGVLQRRAATQEGRVRLAVLVAHPGRPPRQMLERPLQILPLFGPIHWRRAHSAPEFHQLAHREPMGRLGLKHLLQTVTRQQLLCLPSLSHASHQHLLHHVSLPSSLRQERSIHQGPRDTVLPMPIHKLPRPGTQEVLRVLRRTHWPPPSLLVQPRNTHGKLQRKSLGFAPGLARQRRRIGDAGPLATPDVLPRQRLGDMLIFLVFIRAIRNSLHGPRAVGETEVIADAADLHAQKIQQFLRIFSHSRAEVICHAAPTPRGQGIHGQVLPLQELQLATIQNDLAIEVKERIVAAELQGVHHTLLRRSVLGPPLPQRRTQRRPAQLQPLDEDLSRNAIDNLVGRTVRLLPGRADEGHAQAGLHHVTHLGDVDALHVTTLSAQAQRRPLVHNIALPHLGRVALTHLRLGKHIKELRIVVLVHRPDHTLQAPRPEFGQRLQDTRHHIPANLEALQHITVPHIPAQLNHKILVQMPRTPGHVHTRPHAGRLLAPENSGEAVVLQNQHAVLVHVIHRRREDQVLATLDAEALPIRLRRSRLFLLRPLQIRTRATARVHAIAHAILLHLHHAHTRREALQVLREGNRVAPELLQTRLPHLHQRHLHMLQGHDHRLRQRRAPEKLTKLLMRERPTGVHVVQVRAPRNDLHHTLPTLLLLVAVTEEALAQVHLRHQELRLGLLAGTPR